MNVSFLVSGRVQGVGFRWFTREAALRCKVAGWVANHDDGSVRGEVSGSDLAVAEFLRLLQEGPAGSRVDSVESADSGSVAFTGFEIRK